MKNITITKDFKQKATKAVLSIFFFIFIYIAMIFLAIGFAIACGYAAIMLVGVTINIVTVMLGIAIACTGLLILFFMVKFVFTKNKTDRSHLIEIYEKDEPKLFSLIRDIVNEAETPFPKRIYISHEVNASVFYDSGFWSMFFPVKKNLHIGLGLMNSVTIDEFKAIVAHEFGHFSQKSMKVGSYVYNVNYIIHNMLYDNDSFEKLVAKGANMNNYFALVAMGGIKIVEGIQWILRKVYQVVNINYMALSREMEFHADEVAANIAGSKPVATSLLRSNLADFSLNAVLDFYGKKINDNILPDNIFPQQRIVMTLQAKDFNVPFENELPQLTLEMGGRFNKSKIEFEDQWASHPSNRDRIKRVEQLNMPTGNANGNHSISLFGNPVAVQQRVTANLFSTVTYTEEPHNHTTAEFELEFIESRNKNTFPKKFNNYYDDSVIDDIDFGSLGSYENLSEEILFSTESVDQIYNHIGLKNDLESLNNVVSGLYKVKTFDYDGQRYKSSEAASLIPEIEKELDNVKAQIDINNKMIYSFYYTVAKRENREKEYQAKYQAYNNHNKSLEEKYNILSTLSESMQFIYQTTPFDTIKAKMPKVNELEKPLKQEITLLLNNISYTPLVTTETRELLDKYISRDWVYFSGTSYDNDALGLLSGSIDAYSILIGDMTFTLKKDFLDFQAAIVKDPVEILN